MGQSDSWITVGSRRLLTNLTENVCETKGLYRACWWGSCRGRVEGELARRRLTDRPDRPQARVKAIHTDTQANPERERETERERQREREREHLVTSPGLITIN